MSSRSTASRASIACARSRKCRGAMRRDGPVHRPRPRDGRRLLLRPVRVQPRDAGACASRAPRSSRSSTRPRSTTAIRRPRSCSTSRSRSIRATARSGRRRTSKASRAARTRCAIGIEHSINQMTVRLARDIGMPLIVEYAKRFGIYDDLPPYLSMSLGAGETTVLRMVDRLFDVRQWRQAHQGDADRPHPGPLGPHDLPARRAHLRGLRRRRNGTTRTSRSWSTSASR